MIPEAAKPPSRRSGGVVPPSRGRVRPQATHSQPKKRAPGVLSLYKFKCRTPAQSALTLQRNWRGARDREKFAVKKEHTISAVTKVPCSFGVVPRLYNVSLCACLQLQATYRGQRTRRGFASMLPRKQSAASMLQAGFRERQSRYLSHLPGVCDQVMDARELFEEAAGVLSIQTRSGWAPPVRCNCRYHHSLVGSRVQSRPGCFNCHLVPMPKLQS